MAKTRAIMTETERERIAGRDDVEEIKRYQAITRVRGRIEDELVQDVEVLEEHHPGLLEELRDVVCADTGPDKSAAEESPSSERDDLRDDPSDSGEAKVIPGTDVGDEETPDHSQAGLTDLDQGAESLTDDVRAYLEERPPATNHGTEALLDSFLLLREREVMKTGEMKEELSKKYGDRYSSVRAMWETIARYLEDVPGVQKGGYGEWEYAGDDVAREDLAAAE